MNPPDPNVEVVAAALLASPKVVLPKLLLLSPRAEPNAVPAIPLGPAMPIMPDPDAEPKPVLRGQSVVSCVGLATRPGLTGPISGEKGVGPVETAPENRPWLLD